MASGTHDIRLTEGEGNWDKVSDGNISDGGKAQARDKGKGKDGAPGKDGAKGKGKSKGKDKGYTPLLCSECQYEVSNMRTYNGGFKGKPYKKIYEFHIPGKAEGKGNFRPVCFECRIKTLEDHMHHMQTEFVRISAVAHENAVMPSNLTF